MGIEPPRGIWRCEVKANDHKISPHAKDRPDHQVGFFFFADYTSGGAASSGGKATLA